ncbi:MAG: BrnA antitoxin family protein [Betaproteobacteria bacterium]|nr:BrnA antitoxin family protein [Betaproteobacteria bacterium]
MKKPLLPLIDEDGEVRELTQEDMALFRPAREALPAALYEGLASLKNRGGRPKSVAPKIQTAIRFDPDVLAALKATGRGWQTRVNDAMREWLKARG